MANLMDFSPYRKTPPPQQGQGGMRYAGGGRMWDPGAGGFVDLRRQPGSLPMQGAPLGPLPMPQTPDMLGGLPPVRAPEPTFDPYGGFAEGAMGGLDIAMLFKILQGLRGPNPAARNPMIEGAYQAQRVGERTAY